MWMFTKTLFLFQVNNIYSEKGVFNVFFSRFPYLYEHIYILIHMYIMFLLSLLLHIAFFL